MDMRWWWPLAAMFAILIVGAIGAATWDGPIPTGKFGTVADWAEAFGAVTAISLALLQRQDQASRRQRAVLQRKDRQNKLREDGFKGDHIEGLADIEDRLGRLALEVNDVPTGEPDRLAKWTTDFRIQLSEASKHLVALSWHEAATEIDSVASRELPNMLTKPQNWDKLAEAAQDAAQAIGDAISSGSD